MATINLTILGLNRLGASFGLAAKRYNGTPNAAHRIIVTGADDSADTVQAARKLEAIDQDARSAAAAVGKADLVLLTARPGQHDALYAAFAPALKPGAVVIDFAPLKERAIQRSESLLPRDDKGSLLAYMVGATPVINPARLHDALDSIENAHVDLFDKGMLVLSPSVKCRGEAIQLASDFGGLLGMKIHFTDPTEHDGMVAMLEMLPLLANLGLFQAIQRNHAWEDLQRLGNPSFALGTLGLGQHTAKDVAALFDGSRERAGVALESLIDALIEVREVLNVDDPLLLSDAFEDSINKRAAWLAARGLGDWDAKYTVKPAETPTIGSVLGSRFLPRGMRPGDDSKSDEADELGKGGKTKK